MWLLAIREEQMLYLFKNKVFGEIYRCKREREGGAEGGKKKKLQVCTKKLHYLYIV
jgi:hypothetical protein